MDSDGEQSRGQKRQKKIRMVILLLAAVVAAIIALVNIARIYEQNKQEKITEENFSLAMQSFAPSISPSIQPVPSAAPTQEASLLDRTRKDPDREIDFNGLIGANPDVFAWICIPGTEIDYPVVHTNSNSYYLEHNALKEESKSGAIFSDMQNLRGFTDTNVVLYGHRMKSGSMFAGLLQYQDKAFFDENNLIEIYTPAGKWEYEIFAAYIRDDANILSGIDWNNKEDYQAYLNGLEETHDLNAHRSNAAVTTEDNILTLSTCVQGEEHQRFIVQAVLK